MTSLRAEDNTAIPSKLWRWITLNISLIPTPNITCNDGIKTFWTWKNLKLISQVTCLWQIVLGVFVWNEVLKQVRASWELRGSVCPGRGPSRMPAATQPSRKKASPGEWRGSRRPWTLRFGEGVGSEGHWREDIFSWPGRVEAASPGDQTRRWRTAERPSCSGRMAHSFPGSSSTRPRGGRRQSSVHDCQELNDTRERTDGKPEQAAL